MVGYMPTKEERWEDYLRILGEIISKIENSPAELKKNKEQAIYRWYLIE